MLFGIYGVWVFRCLAVIRESICHYGENIAKFIWPRLRYIYGYLGFRIKDSIQYFNSFEASQNVGDNKGSHDAF